MNLKKEIQREIVLQIAFIGNYWLLSVRGTLPSDVLLIELDFYYCLNCSAENIFYGGQISLRCLENHWIFSAAID